MRIPSFDYCPSMASLLVWPRCPKTRQNRCQEILTAPPWRTRGDHRDVLVLCGWRLSSRTWNPMSSPWVKQLMWPRIGHSGVWCLCLALRTPCGGCHRRRRRRRRRRRWWKKQDGKRLFVWWVGQLTIVNNNIVNKQQQAQNQALHRCIYTVHRCHLYHRKDGTVAYRAFLRL